VKQIVYYYTAKLRHRQLYIK